MQFYVVHICILIIFLLLVTGVTIITSLTLVVVILSCIICKRRSIPALNTSEMPLSDLTQHQIETSFTSSSTGYDDGALIGQICSSPEPHLPVQQDARTAFSLEPHSGELGSLPSQVVTSPEPCRGDQSDSSPEQASSKFQITVSLIEFSEKGTGSQESHPPDLRDSSPDAHSHERGSPFKDVSAALSSLPEKGTNSPEPHPSDLRDSSPDPCSRKQYFSPDPHLAEQGTSSSDSDEQHQTIAYNTRSHYHRRWVI